MKKSTHLHTLTLLGGLLVILLIAGIFISCRDDEAEKKTMDTTFPDITGKWEGTLEFSKQKLEIFLEFQKTDNGTIALLSVPAQGVQNMAADSAGFYNVE